MTPDEIIERVIALWDREGGWIPGCSGRQLAVALGVPEHRVRTAQQLKADGVAPGFLEV